MPTDVILILSPMVLLIMLVGIFLPLNIFRLVFKYGFNFGGLIVFLISLWAGGMLVWVSFGFLHSVLAG